MNNCRDYELMILDLNNISESKINDRYGLAKLIFPKNTIIDEDRDYCDFQLMLNRTQI